MRAARNLFDDRRLYEPPFERRGLNPLPAVETWREASHPASDTFHSLAWRLPSNHPACRSPSEPASRLVLLETLAPISGH